MIADDGGILAAVKSASIDIDFGRKFSIERCAGAEKRCIANLTALRIDIHSPALYFSLTSGTDGAVHHHI
jgi:hypothetical protein